MGISRKSAMQSRLKALVSSLACLMSLATCAPPTGEALAIIDPVFAFLAPSAVDLMEAAVKNLVILPDVDTSAALYAQLDTLSPTIILLTPLLGSELEAILSRNESSFIGYLGVTAPKESSKLFSTIFSSVDAAKLAGTQAAIASIQNSYGNDIKVGAIFAPLQAEPPDSRVPLDASEAFLTSYKAGGGIGEPYIEVSQQAYSQSTADRLAKLDIQVGYISASPRETERWRVEAFDASAFIVAEFALPDDPLDIPVSAVVAWDLESAMDILQVNARQHLSGSSEGPWKYLVYQKPNGKP